MASRGFSHSQSYSTSSIPDYAYGYSSSRRYRSRRPQRPPPLATETRHPQHLEVELTQAPFPRSFSESNLTPSKARIEHSRTESELPSYSSSSSLTYYLSANPKDSGFVLFAEDGMESDDEMHQPDKESYSYSPDGKVAKGAGKERRGTMLTGRGCLNLGTILLVILGLLGLFIG